jgi:hypothetical protein
MSNNSTKGLMRRNGPERTRCPHGSRWRRTASTMPMLSAWSSDVAGQFQAGDNWLRLKRRRVHSRGDDGRIAAFDIKARLERNDGNKVSCSDLEHDPEEHACGRTRRVGCRFSLATNAERACAEVMLKQKHKARWVQDDDAKDQSSSRQRLA